MKLNNNMVQLLCVVKHIVKWKFSSLLLNKEKQEFPSFKSQISDTDPDIGCKTFTKSLINTFHWEDAKSTLGRIDLT